MSGDTYIVACLDEGELVLATRQTFASEEKALVYAATVAQSRNPVVIAGRWNTLRPPANHMFIARVYERFNDRCYKCNLREEAHV